MYVEWQKLLHEVLNLYIGRHNLASEKKLSQKDKLNLESAHILLSAAIESVPTRKLTQVALKQTAPRKQAKRVARTMLCSKLGVILPRMMMMTIYPSQTGIQMLE